MTGLPGSIATRTFQAPSTSFDPGFDHRCVIAKRAQCGPCLAGGALRQAADHLCVEFLRGRQAVQARQRLHVFKERALDAGELDLKLRVLVVLAEELDCAGRRHPGESRQAESDDGFPRSACKFRPARRRQRCSNQATITTTATTAIKRQQEGEARENDGAREFRRRIHGIAETAGCEARFRAAERVQCMACRRSRRRPRRSR